MQNILENFSQEKQCIYKNERYSVRDNGSVLRHSRCEKQKRKLDEIWTFGKQDKNGYMYLAAARIHRIVALAFLGEPPSKEHIVDHIDTNRCNNRPENLRYLTKLENAILNPITREKIIYHCGSVEAFLENPNLLRNKAKEDRSLSWMRQVSKEEAKIALANLEYLFLHPKKSIENKKNRESKGLGEWIYTPFYELKYTEDTEEEIDEYLEAFFPQTAKQKEWRTPASFPLCPTQISQTPLQDYYKNLKKEAIFSSHEEFYKQREAKMALKMQDSSIPDISHLFPHSNEIQKRESKILDFAFCKEKERLFIVCEFCNNDFVKPFSLASIHFEKGFFIHTSLGTFFEKDGAYKKYTLAQGLEWAGGETFDDYC